MSSVLSLKNKRGFIVHEGKKAFLSRHDTWQGEADKQEMAHTNLSPDLVCGSEARWVLYFFIELKVPW